MDGDSTTAQAQKDDDAAGYDATAGAFDELTERHSAGIAEGLLDLARLQPADRVLDLGCGTGLVALRAARRTPQGQVVGIDHSAGMLAEASAKAAHRGLSERTAFRKMDAEALEFPDGAFDAIVSLFVLLHLPNPAAAVAEMHRVLAPGGRLVIGVGSGPSLFTPQGVSAAVRTVMSRIALARGRLLTSPEFLRELMAEHGMADEAEAHHHHDTPNVATVLQNAGFAEVRASWLGTTVELDPEEFWSVQAIYDSAVRSRLAGYEPGKVATLKADFLDRAGRVRAKGGKLVYRYGAMFYATQR